VPDRILAMGERFGPVIGARYREAFGRSSFDGMVNYYRANYGSVVGGASELPDLAMPVLQFHGLEDTAVDKHGLENTWDWIAADYTLVTIPGTGHWVQSEASELVSATMKSWLIQRRKP
jgi:pimeloyl-ACP methyl ester carboxylesterase